MVVGQSQVWAEGSLKLSFWPRCTGAEFETIVGATVSRPARPRARPRPSQTKFRSRFADPPLYCSKSLLYFGGEFHFGERRSSGCVRNHVFSERMCFIVLDKLIDGIPSRVSHYGNDEARCPLRPDEHR